MIDKDLINMTSNPFDSYHYLDVLIITLKSKLHKKIKSIQDILPYANVSLQNGVDVRKSSAQNLYNSGTISPTAYTTIQEGRKWHWEINSNGAVGLILANRIALKKGDNSLLLLEDDFYIKKTKQFSREINILQQNTESFDIAVFGALFHGKAKDLIEADFMPKGWYFMKTNKFWYTHCVLYSPMGRKKIRNILEEGKYSMQIDGLYSFLAETNIINVLLQVQDSSVVQNAHLSEIQNDSCSVCDEQPNYSLDMKPSSHVLQNILKIIFFAVLITIVLVFV